jgi:hypothetical protein
MLGGIEGVARRARGMRVNATGASLSCLLSAQLAAIAGHSRDRAFDKPALRDTSAVVCAQLSSRRSAPGLSLPTRIDAGGFAASRNADYRVWRWRAGRGEERMRECPANVASCRLSTALPVAIVVDAVAAPPVDTILNHDVDMRRV